MDVPVHDVAAGIFTESVIEETGDIDFCLIMLAQSEMHRLHMVVRCGLLRCVCTNRVLWTARRNCCFSV